MSVEALTKYLFYSTGGGLGDVVRGVTVYCKVGENYYLAEHGDRFYLIPQNFVFSRGDTSDTALSKLPKLLLRASDVEITAELLQGGDVTLALKQPARDDQIAREAVKLAREVMANRDEQLQLSDALIDRQKELLGVKDKLVSELRRQIATLRGWIFELLPHVDRRALLKSVCNENEEEKDSPEKPSS